MEQKILKVGDVIEFEGKKYRAEAEPEHTCEGCALVDDPVCPVVDCGGSQIIFKEVEEAKETPRRHIELGVVKVEGDRVTFRIVEQTHRTGKFSRQENGNFFRASNGITFESQSHPVWRSDTATLFCRGNWRSEDNAELTSTAAAFAWISEAVSEYNATDGKGGKGGGEKPWPLRGSTYFYIMEDGKVYQHAFDGDGYDCDLQDFGNFFRTAKEAEAAAEKVRALLKELAVK